MPKNMPPSPLHKYFIVAERFYCALSFSYYMRYNLTTHNLYVRTYVTLNDYLEGTFRIYNLYNLDFVAEKLLSLITKPIVLSKDELLIKRASDVMATFYAESTSAIEGQLIKAYMYDYDNYRVAELCNYYGNDALPILYN